MGNLSLILKPDVLSVNPNTIKTETGDSQGWLVSRSVCTRKARPKKGNPVSKSSIKADFWSCLSLPDAAMPGPNYFFNKHVKFFSESHILPES